MNIMEFKIAVIEERLYGDRSLIAKGPPDPSQENRKGFYDEELKILMQRGTGNAPLNQ